MNESVLEKRKERIINERENGTSVADIQRDLDVDVSYTLIVRKLFEWGLDDYFNLDKHKDEILKMKFEEGKTNAEIAEEVGKGYDPSLISLAFSRWDITRTTDPQFIKKQKDKEDLEKSKKSVIEWYHKTGSVEKLSKIFHKSKRAIKEKLREWDVINFGQGPGNSYWQEKYYSIPESERSEILGTYYERFHRAVIKDENYQSISEDLDLNINTVKTGIHRAKNKISEYLNERN